MQHMHYELAMALLHIVFILGSWLVEQLPLLGQHGRGKKIRVNHTLVLTISAVKLHVPHFQSSHI